MNYIIKTIQGCNLSCVYCYEQRHNRRNRAMSLEDAKCFLQKVFDYYIRNRPEEVLAFHWHGGEPMLLGADFFEEIIGFQERLFGREIRWFNTMQSNLSLLDDSFIELYGRHGARLSVGISFDFFGDARVDKKNRSTNERVWANVKGLQEAGIETNFVTMLTKENVGRIDELYDFVRFEKVSIRFNQIFDAPRKRAFDRPPVRLSNQVFSEALKRLTQRWINDSECSFTIDNAERVMMKIANPDSTRMCWYEKNCLEGHMAICPDGTVFPCDSVYFKELSYGNIFHDSYERIVSSEPRQKLLNALGEVREGCGECQYLDYCNGGCPARAMFRMPRKDRVSRDFRFGRDPLCKSHFGLFEMIGEYLARNGVVASDWTKRSLPR